MAGTLRSGRATRRTGAAPKAIARPDRGIARHMGPLIGSAKRAARRFGRDTRGSVTIEFVIMMPLIFWAFMALYVYFDGYRQSSINLKAAYTVSDILSRETGTVDDTYIDSMHALFDFLIANGTDTGLRISVLRWSGPDDRYYVDWSTERDWAGGEILSDGNVMDHSAKLPVMSNAERLILVETRNTYLPVFKVGLGEMKLDNFVFTSPRFVQNVAWQG
ncbi:TadE/TadG family type IV pilus assembly protein [Marinibacterium sp. SX1]|uniref:TadE/TadG family type IV pilus assembly protein n=1 Tax=Marinibacterium sp. SX1 TaxID=3388424 RepID=UPI003D16C251